MTTLDAAFAAWMAFLSSVSVDTDVVLNPPATDSDIQELQNAIGFELPDELTALYKITNGQQDPYHVDPVEGKYATSLLGSYDFLSTTQVIQQYQFLLDIHRDIGSEMDYEITARDGDFVDAVYWKKSWVPIAGSDANQIAVDLDPPRGGTYGQLIIIGPDEFERRVLATSLSEFFETATNNTPNDECALSYGVPDNSDAHVPIEHRIRLNPYVMHIEAEWNHPFYRDNCTETPSFEQPEYLNQSNAINQRFLEWLPSQNISEDRISYISNMSNPQLAQIMEDKAGGGGIFPDWFAPGARIPQLLLDSGLFRTEEFPDGIIPWNFELPNVAKSMYIGSLGFKLACQKATNDTSADVLTLDEYRLFHRYLTIEGIWSEEEYQQADEAMQNLPDVEASGDAASGSTFCSSKIRD